MFWWLEIVRGRPTRHSKAEKSLLMMRKFWSTFGQQVLPKFRFFRENHEIYREKYHQKFSNTVLGYKKGSKAKYFSGFKKYDISAFKRTINRPCTSFWSQDKSRRFATSVSKIVTFEENKPFFTTKIDFFNLLCAIMGWSLSTLDWLMGAVSTLKPNLNIRGSFWENPIFGPRMTVLV